MEPSKDIKHALASLKDDINKLSGSDKKFSDILLRIQQQIREIMQLSDSISYCQIIEIIEKIENIKTNCHSKLLRTWLMEVIKKLQSDMRKREAKVAKYLDG